MDELIRKLHAGEFDSILPHEYVLLRKILLTTENVPVKVFCNTGLEYRQIVEHVKTFSNVTVLRPAMGFTRVLKEYGLAIGSKKIAMQIRRLREYIANPSSKNEATKNLYLTGIKSDGTKGNSMLPKKWRKLLHSNIKVSEQCCDVFKKDPFNLYEKKTGRKPIIGTLAEESDLRTVSYLKTGCNSFEKGKEACRPLSIFTTSDIWEMSDMFNIRFCSIYYERTISIDTPNGPQKLTIEGEEQTGCAYCSFGLHREPKNKPNRIQRLAWIDPQYYNIAVHKCGLKEAYELMDIPYKPFPIQTELFNQNQ